MFSPRGYFPKPPKGWRVAISDFCPNGFRTPAWLRSLYKLGWPLQVRLRWVGIPAEAFLPEMRLELVQLAPRFGWCDLIASGGRSELRAVEGAPTPFGRVWHRKVGRVNQSTSCKWGRALLQLTTLAPQCD